MNKETESRVDSHHLRNNTRRVDKPVIHLDIRDILLQCGITMPEWLESDANITKYRKDKHV
ncbi:hypothetical protein P4H61_01935 [Paenibacillus peoriae]|uniref:hypothetical protein n=1 Tax=Paenibacillus peoriae TaxID=59893 RepID=UPI00058591A3|nr:hypothetical protein [Paenibacillus peoriae]MEC0180260.1 hypothetical protein [Paenibacillus peoriae]